MATNRIQIVNWRIDGDDESYNYFAVYPASETTTAMEEIQQEVDADYEWDQDETPEDRGDLEHTIYVNDDITIVDGEVLHHNGRKFRVTITEVTE